MSHIVRQFLHLPNSKLPANKYTTKFQHLKDDELLRKLRQKITTNLPTIFILDGEIKKL